MSECSTPGVALFKKKVLKNYATSTAKHLCGNLLFKQAGDLRLSWKKRLRYRFFSCKFCEISKNAYSVGAYANKCL